MAAITLRPTELWFGNVIEAYRISIRYGKDADTGGAATSAHPGRGCPNVRRARIRRGEGAGHRRERPSGIFAGAAKRQWGGSATWCGHNREVPRVRFVELVSMLLWEGLDGMLKPPSAG